MSASGPSGPLVLIVFLLTCGCYKCLPYGAMCLPALRECGISWLYSLTFAFCYNKSGQNQTLSYDVASESEITSCNKFDKPLVFLLIFDNVMTPVTSLRT